MINGGKLVGRMHIDIHIDILFYIEIHEISSQHLVI